MAANSTLATADSGVDPLPAVPPVKPLAGTMPTNTAAASNPTLGGLSAPTTATTGAPATSGAGTTASTLPAVPPATTAPPPANTVPINGVQTITAPTSTTPANTLGAASGVSVPSAASVQGYSYTDPTSGKDLTSTTAPTGIPYRLSAPLSADGTSTPGGTTSNAFNGYVSPEGGGFGSLNTDASTALRSLESLSGIDSGTTWNGATNTASGGDPTKFGLPANASATDIHNLALQMSAIANGDPKAIQAGLSSSNPFLQKVAQSYSKGYGSQGLPAGTTFDTAPQITSPTGAVPTANSALPTDPNALGSTVDAALGRSDPTTATTGAPAAAPITGSPAPTPGLSAPSTATSGAPAAAPVPANVGATVAQALGTGSTAPRSAPSTNPTLTPTDPNNPLTAQTISTPALANRFQTALDQLKIFNDAQDPTYQASLRDANRTAAASGALGSGRLNTSIGDLQAQNELAKRTEEGSLLNEALTGSIQDAKDATTQADQQQAFQAGQQGTAFNQGVTQTQLSDALTNSAFQRALQQLTAGSSGDPSSVLLALSQIFGNQSTAAGNAVGGLVKDTTTNNNTQNSTADLLALLKQLGIGTGSTASGAMTANGLPTE